jgi:electron-transferring-flavoprotein dehydrogenase
MRNAHQAFGPGVWAGAAHAGLIPLTRGWWPRALLSSEAGHERIVRLARYYRTERPDPDSTTNAVKVDRTVTFDKLTNVHYSGTRHDEDQPAHLLVQDTDVCRSRCREEYGNPCVRFCPANVYEMVPDGDDDGRRLQINASNCVHCKTCDIMDPYQIIDWVPPEGGGGPEYEGM